MTVVGGDSGTGAGVRAQPARPTERTSARADPTRAGKRWGAVVVASIAFLPVRSWHLAGYPGGRADTCSGTEAGSRSASAGALLRASHHDRVHVYGPSGTDNATGTIASASLTTAVTCGC